MRAPDWAVNGGADFDTPIGSSQKFGISADAAYSSGYFTTVQNIPNSRQDGYWIISIRAHRDRRWPPGACAAGKELEQHILYHSERRRLWAGIGAGNGNRGAGRSYIRS